MWTSPRSTDRPVLSRLIHRGGRLWMAWDWRGFSSLRGVMLCDNNINRLIPLTRTYV